MTENNDKGAHLTIDIPKKHTFFLDTLRAKKKISSRKGIVIWLIEKEMECEDNADIMGVVNTWLQQDDHEANANGEE